VAKVTESKDKFNIDGIVLRSEPLWRHTTFLLGGPADYYAVPSGEEDLRSLLRTASENGIDTFILGGGSNILVADRGFPGLVVDTLGFSEYRSEDGLLVLGAGLDVSGAAWRAGSSGLAGLDFLFGMPGTVGGALWMNARCYDREISEVLSWAETMDEKGTVHRETVNPHEWGYKKSPFQRGGRVILRAAFNMKQAGPEDLKAAMLEKRNDRESKGHYRSPCAGSAFKNNRDFGAPSGAIIDRCGLKGFRIGGAAVSPWHGNIIINDRGARARDVRDLLEEVGRRVEESTGFRMEWEILTIGDWRS
jgi:UDP-N-acetylmuramate dehydrogenase